MDPSFTLPDFLPLTAVTPLLDPPLANRKNAPDCVHSIGI